MTMPRKQLVARRFGRAAAAYDRSATVQRLAADRLAGAIVAAGLPAQPRILEIGCGTGLLTGRLRDRLSVADWTITDLSDDMVRQCRAGSAAGLDGCFLAMDAEAPAVRPGFDLVCGSFTMQWFEDRRNALRALAALLNPGGLLALSTLSAGSFTGWRAALRAEGAMDAMPDHPAADALQSDWPGGGMGMWRSELVLDRHRRGIDFLRGLRAIGADLPKPGAAPLDPLTLRRVLRRFERDHGAVAEYRVAVGLYRRASQRGVFVTGTDTGVGKTIVSACLVRAWGARYWKPMQTGLSDEPGDTPTVTQLAGLAPDRVLPPRYALRAPLSPQAAADLEGVAIEPGGITLPAPAATPLVVEGAGGLMVPVGRNQDGRDEMMIDLIARFGLPVVLVARGTLGTINHTLLSLEALRARAIPVAGVVLNGSTTPGNREAIARLGRVRILAELPQLARLDRGGIARLAALIPPLSSLEDAAPQ